MKKFAITLVTVLSLALQSNAVVTVLGTGGNGPLAFAAGTIVFGVTVNEIDYSKDSFNNTMTVVLGVILSAIAFKSENQSLVFKPINFQQTENRNLGLTEKQITAYNSSLPLINSLFQSLNQNNNSLEQKVAYLAQNKHMINADAQVVLSKLFSVAKN
jgi:hypothetical protein